ncbi:hypothetical protein LUU34_01307200 [Aix galericulata]|nr:hypothetical protein LUU34_01307200 [Aix galericulata]
MAAPVAPPGLGPHHTENKTWRAVEDLEKQLHLAHSEGSFMLTNCRPSIPRHNLALHIPCYVINDQNSVNEDRESKGKGEEAVKINFHSTLVSTGKLTDSDQKPSLSYLRGT